MGTGVTALGSGSVGIGPGFWFSFDIRVYNIAFLFARDVCTGKVFGNFFFFFVVWWMGICLQLVLRRSSCTILYYLSPANT